jgi:hypothetical protein
MKQPNAADSASVKFYLQCVQDILSQGPDKKSLNDWGFSLDSKKTPH